MPTVQLEYRRIHEMKEHGYDYEGMIYVSITPTVKTVGEEVGPAPFRKFVGRLHELLRQYPEITSIVFQRVDHEGIPPFELTPDVLQLLRIDPVAAYRAMEFNNPNSVSGHTAPKEFNPQIHLRVNSGKIENPLTGNWSTLAYGSKKGWLIRGEGNDSSKWLQLNMLIDGAPEGSIAIERLAFAAWALVGVDTLLKTDNSHFYLPLPWNTNGPWIGRAELQKLYEQSKEEAT